MEVLYNAWQRNQKTTFTDFFTSFLNPTDGNYDIERVVGAGGSQNDSIRYLRSKASTKTLGNFLVKFENGCLCLYQKAASPTLGGASIWMIAGRFSPLGVINSNSSGVLLRGAAFSVQVESWNSGNINSGQIIYYQTVEGTPMYLLDASNLANYSTYTDGADVYAGAHTLVASGKSRFLILAYFPDNTWTNNGLVPAGSTSGHIVSAGDNFAQTGLPSRGGAINEDGAPARAVYTVNPSSPAQVTDAYYPIQMNSADWFKLSRGFGNARSILAAPLRQNTYCVTTTVNMATQNQNASGVPFVTCSAIGDRITNGGTGAAPTVATSTHSVTATCNSTLQSSYYMFHTTIKHYFTAFGDVHDYTVSSNTALNALGGYAYAPVITVEIECLTSTEFYPPEQITLFEGEPDAVSVVVAYDLAVCMQQQLSPDQVLGIEDPHRNPVMSIEQHQRYTAFMRTALSLGFPFTLPNPPSEVMKKIDVKSTACATYGSMSSIFRQAFHEGSVTKEHTAGWLSAIFRGVRWLIPKLPKIIEAVAQFFGRKETQVVVVPPQVPVNEFAGNNTYQPVPQKAVSTLPITDYEYTAGTCLHIDQVIRDEIERVISTPAPRPHTPRFDEIEHTSGMAELIDMRDMRDQESYEYFFLNGTTLVTVSVDGQFVLLRPTGQNFPQRQLYEFNRPGDYIIVRDDGQYSLQPVNRALPRPTLFLPSCSKECTSGRAEIVYGPEFVEPKQYRAHDVEQLRGHMLAEGVTNVFPHRRSNVVLVGRRLVTCYFELPDVIQCALPGEHTSGFYEEHTSGRAVVANRFAPLAQDNDDDQESTLLPVSQAPRVPRANQRYYRVPVAPPQEPKPAPMDRVNHAIDTLYCITPFCSGADVHLHPDYKRITAEYSDYATSMPAKWLLARGTLEVRRNSSLHLWTPQNATVPSIVCISGIKLFTRIESSTRQHFSGEFLGYVTTIHIDECVFAHARNHVVTLSIFNEQDDEELKLNINIDPENYPHCRAAPTIRRNGQLLFLKPRSQDEAEFARAYAYYKSRIECLTLDKGHLRIANLPSFETKSPFKSKILIACFTKHNQIKPCTHTLFVPMDMVDLDIAPAPADMPSLHHKLAVDIYYTFCDVDPMFNYARCLDMAAKFINHLMEKTYGCRMLRSYHADLLDLDEFIAAHADRVFDQLNTRVLSSGLPLSAYPVTPVEELMPRAEPAAGPSATTEDVNQFFFGEHTSGKAEVFAPDDTLLDYDPDVQVKKVITNIRDGVAMASAAESGGIDRLINAASGQAMLNSKNFRNGIGYGLPTQAFRVPGGVAAYVSVNDAGKPLMRVLVATRGLPRTEILPEYNGVPIQFSTIGGLNFSRQFAPDSIEAMSIARVKAIAMVLNNLKALTKNQVPDQDLVGFVNRCIPDTFFSVRKDPSSGKWVSAPASDGQSIYFAALMACLNLGSAADYCPIFTGMFYKTAEGLDMTISLDALQVQDKMKITELGNRLFVMSNRVPQGAIHIDDGVMAFTEQVVVVTEPRVFPLSYCVVQTKDLNEVKEMVRRDWSALEASLRENLNPVIFDRLAGYNDVLQSLSQRRDDQAYRNYMAGLSEKRRQEEMDAGGPAFIYYQTFLNKMSSLEGNLRSFIDYSNSSSLTAEQRKIMASLAVSIQKLENDNYLARLEMKSTGKLSLEDQIKELVLDPMVYTTALKTAGFTTGKRPNVAAQGIINMYRAAINNRIASYLEDDPNFQSAITRLQTAKRKIDGEKAKPTAAEERALEAALTNIPRKDKKEREQPAALPKPPVAAASSASTSSARPKQNQASTSGSNRLTPEEIQAMIAEAATHAAEPDEAMEEDLPSRLREGDSAF